VSGVARAEDDEDGARGDETTDDAEPIAPDRDALVDAPSPVADLAAACVRFVAARYGTKLDFEPETLSLVDQWLRDARAELRRAPEAARPEAAELVQAASGAYLGEVIRRRFGAQWMVEGAHESWRLCMSTVFCAYNPLGMTREALLLEPAEGWHAHFELDPGESDAIDARLRALPEVGEDEYYAPSTRFDVVEIVVEALRATMKARGLGDVRFGAEDYVVGGR